MKKKRNKIGYYLSLINRQQKELAEFLGCTKMAVSCWCRGVANPLPKHMDKILAYLNRNRPPNIPLITEDDIIYFG